MPKIIISNNYEINTTQLSRTIFSINIISQDSRKSLQNKSTHHWKIIFCKTYLAIQILGPFFRKKKTKFKSNLKHRVGKRESYTSPELIFSRATSREKHPSIQRLGGIIPLKPTWIRSKDSASPHSTEKTPLHRASSFNPLNPSIVCTSIR